jgi:putative ABC transport system permease protein
MLSRILTKSISRRKSRIAIAVVAVLIGASIAGALVTVSLNIESKVGAEFRQYGANILLVPESDTVSISIGDVDYGSLTEQRFIQQADLSKIDQINWSANILGYAPYLYNLVESEGERAILAGVWFDQIQTISPWWDVQGEWIADRNDTTSAIIGTTVADVLDVGIGDVIPLTYNNTYWERMTNLTISGIVTTGGSEDNQIFTTLALAQNLTDKIGKVSTVQVSALCIGCPVDVIAGNIEWMIPYVKAKSVKQVVNAEMEILGKIEQMMVLVAVVALFASALGVMTTMTASVVERKKEIGLMKAIGAENRKIIFLFSSEAVIIGILGGILGYLTGFGVAEFIGQSVFNSSITPELQVLPMVMALSVGVSLLASMLPIRHAIRVEPARVLRGE